MDNDRRDYMRKYHAEHIKQIKMSVSPAEAEAFDLFCNDIGESKVGLLKRLVNAEAEKRGYASIFDIKRHI